MQQPAIACNNMDTSILFAEDNTSLMLQSMMKSQLKAAAPTGLWTDCPSALAQAAGGSSNGVHPLNRGHKPRAADNEAGKGHGLTIQQELAGRKEDAADANKKRRSRVNPLKEMQDLFQEKECELKRLFSENELLTRKAQVLTQVLHERSKQQVLEDHTQQLQLHNLQLERQYQDHQDHDLKLQQLEDQFVHHEGRNQHLDHHEPQDHQKLSHQQSHQQQQQRNSEWPSSEQRSEEQDNRYSGHRTQQRSTEDGSAACDKTASEVSESSHGCSLEGPAGGRIRRPSHSSLSHHNSVPARGLAAVGGGSASRLHNHVSRSTSQGSLGAGPFPQQPSSPSHSSAFAAAIAALASTESVMAEMAAEAAAAEELSNEQDQATEEATIQITNLGLTHGRLPLICNITQREFIRRYKVMVQVLSLRTMVSDAKPGDADAQQALADALADLRALINGVRVGTPSVYHESQDINLDTGNRQPPSPRAMAEIPIIVKMTHQQCLDCKIAVQMYHSRMEGILDERATISSSLSAQLGNSMDDGGGESEHLSVNPMGNTNKVEEKLQVMQANLARELSAIRLLSECALQSMTSSQMAKLAIYSYPWFPRLIQFVEAAAEMAQLPRS